MFNSWWSRFLFLVGGMVSARWEKPWLLGIIGLIFVFGMIWGKGKRQFFVIFLFCAIIGWTNYHWRILPIPEYLEDISSRTWTGEVTEYKQNIDDEKSSWILETSSPIPWIQRIYIHAYCPIDLHEGDIIQVTGKLRVPRGSRNPGEFNYRQYLADQKIYYTMSLYQDDAIQILQENPSKVSFLEQWKEKRIESVHAILDPEQMSILLGMILGMKENIPDEEYEAFQKTGTVHLMAVSGLHVGFLLLLTEGIFHFLPLGKGKKRILQMLLLVGYGFLTGWPVTVQRAVLMTGLTFLAFQWGRTRNALDILGLAGSLIILYDPTALFSVSFQLSFTAVWGILYLLPILERMIPWKNPVIAAYLLTVAVQIAILPVSMYYFQMCSVSSFFINPIAVWLGAGVIWLGMVGFIASSLGLGMAFIFLYPAGCLLDVLRNLVQLVSRYSGSYLWTPQPPIWVLLVYYSFLMLAFWPGKWSFFRKFRKLAMAAAFVFWMVMFCPQQRVDGELHLTFLDVGQGNCLFLQTPAGKQWMVDGGGDEYYQIGDNVVVPWLHRQGIREIDWMVSTHPDTDHLQGLEAVAQVVPVKNLIIPASLEGIENYQPLLESVQRQGGRVWYVQAGQLWHPEPNMQVEIWNPTRGSKVTVNNSGESTNEESIVMRMAWDQFSFLVTGDVGTKTMENILRTQAIEPVTLLQVPHHGSRNSYSLAFYEALDPTLAVVQCKTNNLYGHPSQEVVDAMEEEQIYLLRSDQDGCITIDTQKGQLKVSRFLRPLEK